MFAKRPNERWLIMSKQGGGQIEVAEKDTVLFSEDGVFVFHNDPMKTTTFVPMSAIAWIRSWFPKDQDRVEGTMRSLNPVEQMPSRTAYITAGAEDDSLPSQPARCDDCGYHDYEKCQDHSEIIEEPRI